MNSAGTTGGPGRPTRRTRTGRQYLSFFLNTIYINAALEQLRKEGFPVNPEDVPRLSPLIYDHINFPGRYAFTLSDLVASGQVRPLRRADATGDDALAGFLFHRSPNPIFNCFNEDWKKEFPNRVFNHLDGVIRQLEKGLARLAADTERLRSLTAWPWIISLNLKAH